ncbi:hypothetical protein ENE75_00820 [Rubrivivax albus]|uniref:O-antigen ligase domain-containing protein n=1 Tax=Rubrivivax albus TaxID=2499835 RepID=A0A3S2TSE5_9BURK|nr:hypothetical protein ENE75_00820 [Rubrivivax albus]
MAPALAAAALILLAVLAAWRPLWIPVALLALLPVAGLAPWTGWMLAEEFDLLLLALLAGGWARLAWPVGLPTRQPATDGAARVWWLLVLMVVGLTAVGTWRGLHDAGAWDADGFAWGWWQGWREPMNVLRTVKPLAWALLAWPLWQALQARAPEAAARVVGHGAWAGLAVVAAVATWERWAWPGLTNFSTDYRTTALFWEAHIGGAALDGFLALTLPFGLWAAAATHGRRAVLLSVGVLCLAGYAVLTTFSRGLYAGALAGVVVWWLMTPRVPAAAGGPSTGPGVLLGWVAVFGVAAALAFSGSGWRGLAALYGLMLLLFWHWQQDPAQEHGGPSAGRAAGVVAVGAVLGALAAALALALPGALKAPYVLYAVCALACAAAWSAPGRRQTGAWAAPLGWAAWAAAAVAALGVALHWGESAARWGMAASVLLLAAAAACGAAWPRWRGAPGGRWRGSALGAMAVAGMVVGSFAGGSYLEGRLATAGEDWQGRLHHWQRSLSLAQDEASNWWGIGPGRFAAHFALSGEATDQVGDYRWQAGPDGGGTLVLTGGKHTLGFGELFRLSQRIAAPEGAVRVRWRAEAPAPVRLHVEICSKHLLYDAGCRTAQAPVGGTAREPQPGWHTGELTLKAAPGWQSPVFSVALDTRGGWIRLDEIEVTDSLGRRLLHNGGFDDGLARWLPSSDRHHLPWHAKNLGLHLRVEQGWLGLLGFAALLVFAVARLTLGRARRHPLTPPLLAGIVGFLIVGAFDSLLDIPRVAFAFLWLLGLAATLRSPAPAAAVPRPASTARSASR